MERSVQKTFATSQGLRVLQNSRWLDASKPQIKKNSTEHLRLRKFRIIHKALEK